MVKGSIFSGSYYSSEEEVKIAKANLINIGFDEIEYFSLGKKYFTQWAGSPRERLDNFYKCWNSNSEIIFGMRGSKFKNYLSTSTCFFWRKIKNYRFGNS